MKILDTQSGRVHEYGTDCHDSLYVSNDGRYLTYYNLQNGDGSGVGDYRFVCDDELVPAESQTADAIHAEVYFNIGGWKKPKGYWKRQTADDGCLYCSCSVCYKNNFVVGGEDFSFCPWCGASMKKGG